MDIALKVDVDTYRGTLEGVPRLVADLGARGIAASFYFSLGPDHTGRALRRVFRKGFLAKVQRTSVVSHYGIRTLLYGVLFGFFCYATFELTSLSLLKHWTWPVVVLDVSWGMVVTALSSTAGLLIANWLAPKI